MDAVMRRSHFLMFALLLLTLVSLPVAARTSPMLSAGEDIASSADIGPPADDQAGLASKSTAAKRTSAPPATKTPPAARGNDTAPARAPRWHRFLPGMYR
jgi:hypothetical protein